MGKSVLIVDDSIFIYESIKEMLSDSSFQVIGHAKSGETAMELYDELHPDLVTMDIIMPDMNGLDSARNILERYPDAKILMISSLAYDDTIREAEEIGACGFLSKPIEKDILIEALDQCLEEN